VQGELYSQRNGSIAQTDTAHCLEEEQKQGEEEEKQKKQKKKKKKKKKTQHHLSPLGVWPKEQAGLAAGQTEEVSLLEIYCSCVGSYGSQKLER